MKLRAAILAGLVLSVLVLAFTAFRYSGFIKILWDNPWYLALLTAALLWYGFVALQRTAPNTPEDALVLRYGTIWGMVIGCAWMVEMVFANVVIPHELGAGVGFLVGYAALLLPVVAGAAGAIKGGKVRAGMRVGFWSGVVSGVIAFLVAATVGYMLALVPGLPGAETPRDGRLYTAAALEQFRVVDMLAAGGNHLLPLGAIYCSVAGAVGAVLGILFARPAASSHAFPHANR